MSIHYRVEDEKIVILGQTYPHKEAIKGIGGRFDGQRKIWYLPNSEPNLKSVDKLCTGVGGGSLEAPDSSQSQIPKAIAKRMDPIPPLGLRRTTESNSVENPKLNEAEGLIQKEVAGFTIKQIMDQVNIQISQKFPLPIWVIGEVQNISNKGRGVYLNLAEGGNPDGHGASLTANATIWQNSMKLMEHRHGKDKLEELLVDGTKIRCLCQVTFYKGRGSISLAIQDIDPVFTKGALALAREKLLKELKIKGLDKANKSLELPPFPFHVGLISAEGSRAESDFTHQLFQGGFPGHISFVPAAAQGERVPKEIPAAMKTLIKANCDIIVITRGGGSAADLRWFDTPEVAYAVAQSPIPVIAAIGHHDDESIAEIVAHMHCKTPTAAAEFVKDCFFDTRRELDEFANTMALSLSRILEFHSEKLSSLGEKMNGNALLFLSKQNELLSRLGLLMDKPFRDHIQRIESLISNLKNKLDLSVTHALNSVDNKLSTLKTKLVSIDPSPWVKQGWTQLFKNKTHLTSIKDIEPGDELTARLLDGNLTLTTKSKENRGTNHD